MTPLGFATVTQATPLLVTLDGAATAIPALLLRAYGATTTTTATVGDRVVVERVGSQLLVLGKAV